MYSEITNNSFIDIFQVVIVDRVTVIFRHLRRIRIAWTWPNTAPIRETTKQSAGYFSGFVTNGLRHWFTGKGRRKAA